jgi:hypothetical protein
VGLAARRLDQICAAASWVDASANNFGGFSNVANIIFPNVLEISFANRSMYSFSETDEIFPGPLDAPNDPSHPDLHLGSFRF